jgi:hypothetical protein
MVAIRLPKWSYLRGRPLGLGGNRRLDVGIPAEELNRRFAAWSPPAPKYVRGYGALYLEHILQADEGCDFDVLRGRSDDPQAETYGLLSGWIGGW